MGNIKETICISSNDVASQFKDLRRAFENEGFTVITYVDELPDTPIVDNDRYNYYGIKLAPKFLHRRSLGSGSKALNLIYRFFRFFAKIYSKQIQFYRIKKEAQVFIFLCDSFNYDSSDLRKIKEAGKKIIYIFVGDDARWYFGMEQDFKLHNLNVYSYGDNYDYAITGLIRRMVKVRNAEKYADAIFSKREQSQIQLRPFYHFPMCVYLDDYLPNHSQRPTNPIVVHAPTHTLMKGTEYVLKAFEELKSEGILFTPILVKDLSHLEAKKVYANADIVIDQLYIPGGGKLSTEAMALGKVVMSRMAYGTYEQGVPLDDCPIIDVSQDSIKDRLREIILDYNKRISLSKQGREYVKNNLDVKILAQKIILIFSGQKIDHDYSPEFFRNSYLPQSDAEKDVLVKWTDFVQECKWYKELTKGKQIGRNFFNRCL